jgi:hypothetical protein
MLSATAYTPHMLRLPLHPYQQEALLAIVDAQTRGVTRPLVVLPVSAGKTVVFVQRQCGASGVLTGGLREVQPPRVKGPSRRLDTVLRPKVVDSVASGLLSAEEP